jgi:hypothetical protein
MQGSSAVHLSKAALTHIWNVTFLINIALLSSYKTHEMMPSRSVKDEPPTTSLDQAWAEFGYDHKFPS